MERKFKTLVENLTFPEGPRWRNGKLYFSDFFTHKVLSTNLSGTTEEIVHVPNQPSGLGWLPDGTLLIVSMIDQKLMALRNGSLQEVADCSEYANFYCNDMIVNKNGDAYIGNFGFNSHKNEEPKSTNLILVRPGEEPRIAADMANIMAPAIVDFTIEAHIKQAKLNREFIEFRQAEVNEKLTEVEEVLKVFRERNRSTIESPQLQLELERLMREVEIQTQVYITLQQQYELSRIEETLNELGVAYSKYTPLTEKSDNTDPPYGPQKTSITAPWVK